MVSKLEVEVSALVVVESELVVEGVSSLVVEVSVV